MVHVRVAHRQLLQRHLLGPGLWRGATLKGNFLENEFVQEADALDSQCPTEANSGRPL
jgi:hypothetical protein